ncbi:MarR family winged helix-turn-helix transcriptional regulator [Salinispira pacifica]|uniref:Transcriptional regulator, MarR family n=1 Tax=Salinispira pacifica TaxID=1307761 RepID=V5WH60_9SPIO|nr:Transcriptional regulator, MarR family [Salinispira pacifica]AHC14894.1 Transcriptional regulator, MarR family [Salinispira pacifica]
MNEELEYQRSIFGHLFRTANILQIFLDRGLEGEDVTSKQLFLMIVVGNFGEKGPTVTQAAEKAGSSYQNVKKLALHLERSGYLRIVSDEDDRRAKRLVMTRRAKDFWQQREQQDARNFMELFRDFRFGELEKFNEYLLRLESQIEKSIRKEQ